WRAASINHSEAAHKSPLRSVNCRVLAAIYQHPPLRMRVDETVKICPGMLSKPTGVTRSQVFCSRHLSCLCVAVICLRAGFAIVRKGLMMEIELSAGQDSLL
ncbi:hypothetical protein JOQ06_018220, partial [Pogonophryne albipinna]